jgi:hypothetical protein
MGMERWWNNAQGITEGPGEKSATAPLCPTQIPHGMTWRRTHASCVRRWRLSQPFHDLIIAGVTLYGLLIYIYLYKYTSFPNILVQTLRNSYFHKLNIIFIFDASRSAHSELLHLQHGRDEDCCVSDAYVKSAMSYGVPQGFLHLYTLVEFDVLFIWLTAAQCCSIGHAHEEAFRSQTSIRLCVQSNTWCTYITWFYLHMESTQMYLIPSVRW